MPELHHAIILFDGACGLCNASVRLIIKNDPAAYFRFAPLQSDTGKSILKQKNISVKEVPESLILIEQGKVWQASSAALRIARKMKMPYPLLYPLLFIPRFIRDFFYQLIARNRHKWSNKNVCSLPDSKTRFIHNHNIGNSTIFQ